jgi:RNA polymerase sigma-70 factor (ECF subfamily)
MADMKVFERLLDETESAVRAYMAGLGVPLDTVDDLAQEVYLEFYKGMDAMPANTLPIRWLKGIARNVCMNHFRRSKRREERRLEALAEILAQTESDSGSAPDTTAQECALQACLQKLTPRQRQIVVLRYEEGITAEKMAHRLGSKAGTIRVTLFRLLRILRECVTQTLQESPT